MSLRSYDLVLIVRGWSFLTPDTRSESILRGMKFLEEILRGLKKFGKFLRGMKNFIGLLICTNMLTEIVCHIAN